MFWNTIKAGTVNASMQRFVVALGIFGHPVLLHMATHSEFADMIAHRARKEAGIVVDPFLGHGIPAAEKALLGFWNECPAEKAGAAILRFLVALEGDADIVLERMKRDPFFISKLASYAKSVATTGAKKPSRIPNPVCEKEVSLGVGLYTYFLRKEPVTQ